MRVPDDARTRPITMLHGSRVLIMGTVDAVLGPDGVWSIPPSELEKEADRAQRRRDWKKRP